MSKFYSPLRYPGGKSRLADFAKTIVTKNNIEDGIYAEVFAGGSGIALSLLFEEYVSTIFINDLDYNIFSFWKSCTDHNEELCHKIITTEVNIEEWQKQREVLKDEKSTLIDRGFATFFLNRTNRSGIITGGVIGGLNQKGNYKIDARYNVENLLKRIQKIGRFSDRIEVTNLDALEYIDEYVLNFPSNSLTYFDPPYFVKGSSDLYNNYFNESDHIRLVNKISNLDQKWFLSYDNVSQVRKLYNKFRSISYGLSYSAQEKYTGKEILFFSNNLYFPLVSDPAKVKIQINQEIKFSEPC